MSAPKHTGESSSQLTVQEAVSLTVHESHDARGQHIPPKAIAEGMNVPVSRLYEIADAARERRLRAEELPSLIRTTGNFLALDVIERALGRVGVMLPTGDDRTVAETAKALQEFGQFVEEIGAAAPHGFTEDEARRIRIEGEQAIACIAAIIRQIESLAHVRATTRPALAHARRQA